MNKQKEIALFMILSVFKH